MARALSYPNKRVGEKKTNKKREALFIISYVFVVLLVLGFLGLCGGKEGREVNNDGCVRVPIIVCTCSGVSVCLSFSSPVFVPMVDYHLSYFMLHFHPFPFPLLASHITYKLQHERETFSFLLYKIYREEREKEREATYCVNCIVVEANKTKRVYLV